MTNKYCQRDAQLSRLIVLIEMCVTYVMRNYPIKLLSEINRRRMRRNVFFLVVVAHD